MKVYIRAATVEQIKEQYAPDMDKALFKELISLDPTSRYESNNAGKYGRWIINQYNKGNLQENNYHNLQDALVLFAKSGKKYPKHDIFQYKTVSEFLKDTNDVLHAAPTAKEQLKDAKRKAKEKSSDDIQFLVEDDTFTVYTPKTWAGAIALAYEGVDKTKDFTPDNPDNMKAQWCTAGESVDRGLYYFNHYTSYGPLYVFIPKNDPINKFQSCFAHEDWWFDKFDHEQGKQAWFDFCDEHPIIKDFFKVVTENGVQYQAGTVIGFDEHAKVIKLPDGTMTVSKRLPHGVEEFYMPDSVTTLCSNICSNLSKLTKVKFSNSLTTIPNNAFENCKSLEQVVIPDSITSYGDSAFSGCSGLKQFKNSSALQSIGNLCFAGCSSLESFSIPDSVIGLGNSCFKDVGFTRIKLPSGLTELGRVFKDDKSIRAVDLNNVTVIYPEAFRNSGIEEINLSGVAKIGSSAFRDCNNLKSVALSSGVSLGSTAFANCPNLTTANVPKECSMQHKSFDNCENLELKWEDSDKPYEFDNIKLLICPASCTQLIDANKDWVDIKTY